MMTLEGYRFSIPETVRFGDLDAMGHLNNARYLTYLEQARILYARQVIGLDGGWNEFRMILARTEIDYKLPIAFGDAIMVYVRVGRIGGKSLDFEMVITRQNGDEIAVAAEARAVMVAFDYDTKTTMSVPQSWRERIHEYEDIAL